MTKSGWRTPHAIMRTGAVSFRAERPRVISSRARNLGIQHTPHAIMQTGGHHCTMSRFARHDKERVAHAARHNANRRPVSFRAERPRVISSRARNLGIQHTPHAIMRTGGHHCTMSRFARHDKERVARAARHNANRRSSLYDVSLRST